MSFPMCLDLYIFKWIEEFHDERNALNGETIMRWLSRSLLPEFLQINFSTALYLFKYKTDTNLGSFKINTNLGSSPSCEPVNKGLFYSSIYCQ